MVKEVTTNGNEDEAVAGAGLSSAPMGECPFGAHGAGPRRSEGRSVFDGQARAEVPEAEGTRVEGALGGPQPPAGGRVESGPVEVARPKVGLARPGFRA